MSNKEVIIILKKSIIGSNEKQKKTIKALKLNKVGDTSKVVLNEATMGMIKKVQHLVEIKK